MSDKRFEVGLSFSVKEVTDGTQKDFFDNESRWHDCSYETVVLLEQIMTNALATTQNLAALPLGEEGYADLQNVAKKAINK